MPASTEFVRAGNWVLGTGLRGAATPDLFNLMDRKLQAVGSSMSLVARLDQYYPHVRCVAPYQAARKQAFEGRQVAPSTSVIVGTLREQQAEVDVQVIAVTAASGYALQEVGTGLNRPDASGYAPCLRAGELIFVAGQLARDATGVLAVHGTVEETDYIVRRRLLPALEAAESGLDLTLKAQVYISRPEELPLFQKIWNQAFGERTPPTTVVPLRHPAFLTADATVEINVIAAHRSAAARVRHIECDVEARMLDGLLFVGGLTSSGMGQVLEQAEKVFKAAGTDLSSVVRALFFHSEPQDLPDPGFPFSVFQVEGSFVADLWGYAPGS